MLPTDDSYPLSPLQEGMLFEHLHLRRPGVDVEQVICRMRNAPDERAFQAAWQRVADRHPTLRTRFCWDGPGKPSQEVVATLVFPFENHDWSRLGRKDWEKKWGDFLLADRVRGFVLDEAPLTRLAVMREPRGGARMCWTFHHLLLDARGIVVMLKEVFVIYEAIKSGVAAGLEPVVPFRRFIDWHAARDWSCSKDFWSKAISGFCGTSSLPAGRPETTTDEDSRGEREIVFSPRITRRLKAWAEQTGVTLNTIVQGCWALLLSRYSGEQDVVFGAIRAGRRGSCDGAESIVGLCINNVPVRVKVPPESLLIPWLRELRDFWVAIREHEHVPLVTVMGWSGTPHGTAMFDTFVNFQDPSWDVALAEQGGEWRRREFSIVSQPGYPLTVDAYGSPSLRIRIYYDRRRYCEADVERMLGHWRTLIEAIAANPERMLRDLPILTKAERRQSVVEWNRTATKYPRNRTIHHLFEEQVMRTPQAVAAVYADEQITYEKLNFRANRIANFLRSLDIGRGALVGICMERSIDLVAGLLGILKAGGAYVPLDPEYPNERLAFMLRDTAAPVLLTQERLLDQLPETSAKVICLDRDWKLVRQHSSDSVKSDVTADDLAYVIYTSGSTGVPKGVCVPHKAVVRLVRNANYISIQPDDRVAQAANASFDAATFEVWGALLNGARVVGISKVDLLSPAKLAGQIRDLGITTLFLTTALFNQLAREIPNAFASLRHLLFGGEAVDPPCVRAVLQGRPPNRLLHVYGPTETTTFATWLHVTEVADGAATVPIGRPISNTEAYVLDPAGNLVPVGAPGELFLGGDGVAAGYLNQPKLTAEKFVPDPFSGKRGARLYRTGDLVRWTSDGCIEFLGRIDHQVKVRGFRIELGEIEMALLKIPEVQEAVVVLREDVPGVRQLAAYIVAKPGMRIQNPRRILGEHLPGYMVPSFMIELAALPLTPNGKIDRRALPGPGRDHSGPEFVAPQTETEELVAGVWSDVLKVPLIGATDHFFGLGGDSLRAMDVIARLRKALGRDIPIRLLFEKPTVESFAAGIQNLQSPEEEMQGLKIVRASREQPVPLSFYQARVWQYAADCRDGTYNNPICFRLKGPLNVPALEHSLTELVRRHEILRTAISVTNGMPSQYIHPPSPVTLRRKEMTGRFYNDDAVVSIFKEETLQPFNLEIDPGFRVLLLRWSPREHMLLFVFHGMIYDGTLRETFFSQLSGLYAAYAANEVPDIPEPKLQYADFALWQRRWLRPDSKIYQRVFNYWKNQLGGELHPLQLPFSRSKPVEENLENAYRAVLVDGELARALSTFSRSHSATLFMTMLAGFKVLLSHHTGVKDLLIGTYFGDRDHPELEGVFGPFSNLLPLRTDLSGATTFRETLARVRETVLQAHANQHLPYEELLKALQTAGCPAPEVRAIVVFTNVVRPIFHLDGLRVGLSLPKLQGAIRSKPWGFTLNITQVGKRMGTVWICDTDKYDPDLVLRMSSQFMDLLKKVVVDIDTPVSDLLADEPLKLRGTTSAEPHFDQS